MQNLLLLTLLLTRSVLAADCVPQYQSERASLHQCDKLRLLYLRGTGVERAREMGRLIHEGTLSPEIMNYFAGKFREIASASSPMLGAAAELVYNQAVRLLHRNTPREIAEEVDAMAAGMGVDAIDLRRALSLPDSAALTNVLGSFAPFRALPAAGCTSLAVAAPDGGFVYGRNLDFAGTGVWDRHPLLTIVEPTEAGGQKHAVFGADGALYGGITGVNEAGLTFAVHQNYTSDGGLSGVPMVFIGELVLRKARSVAEAVEILRATRPAVMWTFVVTNLRTGEAVAVESSPRHFELRQIENGRFVQTNHLMNAPTRETEFVSLGIKMNSIYRMKRAFELLRREAPLASVAETLGYQEDKGGRLNAYYDILKAHTIQTALLEAGKDGQRLYLSVDEAPTATGRFAAFDLGKLWQHTATPQFEIRDFARTPAETRKRQRQISDAFALYFDHHRLTEAAALVAEHGTLDAAYFATVTLTQQDRWQEALHSAEAILGNPRFLAEPAYIRQSIAWIKTAALVRLGKRGEAQAAAESLLGENPENVRLRDFCRMVAEGRTPPAWMMRFSFDFFSGDLHGRAN